jgi:MFS transporter, FSR family, fosmidomycin resistance protein
VGLLIALPLLLGSLLELPLGLVAGSGRRRQWLVLAGGALVAGSLAAVSAASSLALLLVALVAFFPASGAFVSLTQAALMDAAPERRQQRMAAWNLAGSAGAVGGPLLLAGVLAAGGNWRSAYLLLAAAAGAALCGAALAGPARPAPAPDDNDPVMAGPEQGDDLHPGAAGHDEGGTARPSLRQALTAVRDHDVARWLALLQIGDLLLDVLTGYVGLYLVDVAHATPAQAAIGVAIRLGGGMAGDALFVVLASRVSGQVAVRASATAAVLLYPAFLLVPSLPAKLAILAVLSATTSCWYPAMQAGLYSSLPGRSGIALFWSSAAGFAGALGPLAVGLIAQQAGLPWALAGLGAAPVAVLALLPRRARDDSRKVMR